METNVEYEILHSVVYVDYDYKIVKTKKGYKVFCYTICFDGKDNFTISHKVKYYCLKWQLMGDMSISDKIYFNVNIFIDKLLKQLNITDLTIDCHGDILFKN